MKLCEISGCQGKHVAKGMCALHYQRARNGMPSAGWPKVIPFEMDISNTESPVPGYPFFVEELDDLKWIGVDVDGTIAEACYTIKDPATAHAIGAPIWANIEKIRIAVARGFKIAIYTAKPWADYRLVEMYLDTHDIPWHRIICGKMLLRTLVDDRMTHPGSTDWTRPDPLSSDEVAELSWAAGFFDGEGSVFVNRLKRTTHLERSNPAVYDCTTVGLSLSQVDRRPLDRFSLVFPGPRVRGPYGQKTPNSRPYHTWATEGRGSVHSVLVKLWPYMSEPKREQSFRVWDELYASIGPKSPRLPALPDWEPKEINQ